MKPVAFLSPKLNGILSTYAPLNILATQSLPPKIPTRFEPNTAPHTSVSASSSPLSPPSSSIGSVSPVRPVAADMAFCESSTMTYNSSSLSPRSSVAVRCSLLRCYVKTPTSTALVVVVVVVVVLPLLRLPPPPPKVDILLIRQR